MNVERVKAALQKSELPLKGAHQTQNGSGNLGRLNKNRILRFIVKSSRLSCGHGRIIKQLIADNSSSAVRDVTQTLIIVLDQSARQLQLCGFEARRRPVEQMKYKHVSTTFDIVIAP